MDPVSILAIINGAISIIDAITPEIAAAVQKGQISVEQQQALFARLDKLRTAAAFTAPEWQPSASSTPS